MHRGARAKSDSYLRILWMPRNLVSSGARNHAIALRAYPDPAEQSRMAASRDTRPR